MTAPQAPYTGMWAQEGDVTPSVFLGRCPRGYPRLTFRGELPRDRDRHGVLWRRQKTAPGRGSQLTGRIHSHRQRRAIEGMLCPFDAAPAVGGHLLRGGPPHVSESDQALFLLSGDIREGHITAVPPVCWRCTPRLAGARHRQRRPYTAVLVSEVRPWGVAGHLYDPMSVPHRPTNDGLTPVRYRSSPSRWVVAHQALVSLHGITPCASGSAHRLTLVNRRERLPESTDRRLRGCAGLLSSIGGPCPSPVRRR